MIPVKGRAATPITNVDGFSRLMGEDEARALKILYRHDAILAEQVAGFGGRGLKKMGDVIERKRGPLR